MKGFIEITVLNSVYNGQDTKEIKEVELIPISEIAKIYGSVITFKTPYPNGQNYSNTAHTYNEIKELIKNAQ